MLQLTPRASFEELERLRGERDAAWLVYASGERLFLQGRWADAALALAEALRADPQSPLARSALVFLLDTGPARVSALNEISGQWPTLERPRFYLGAAHVADKRPHEAARIFELCTHLAPDDTGAWLQRSEALRLAGDRAAAADTAEHALAVGGEGLLRTRSAAQIIYAAGRRRRAFAIALQAAREDPTLRSLLLPVTLPLQAGSRAFRIGFSVLLLALLVFAFGGTTAAAPRWWALVPAGVLMTLAVLANVSGGGFVHIRQSSRFAATRERLRAELIRDGIYTPL